MVFGNIDPRHRGRAATLDDGQRDWLRRSLEQAEMPATPTTIDRLARRFEDSPSRTPEELADRASPANARLQHLLRGLVKG